MIDDQRGDQEFVRALYSADTRLRSILEKWYHSIHKREGLYALCIGGTSTSDLHGISAAGVDGNSRRLTPAIDAEALVLGKTLSADSIPVSPAGVVSPVVISRAMIDLIGCRTKVFDCGSFVSPEIDCLTTISKIPARSLDTGCALDAEIVYHLFRRGCETGRELAESETHLIVGECVPAGTTTAMAVLTALGYPAQKLVSSSMPHVDRDLRNRLVLSGLKRAGLDSKKLEEDPLLAVAAVGDPMQAFAAGLALEASQRIPVILGGGTQMLTIFALMQAIKRKRLSMICDLAVVTTKWVAFDPHAGACELASLLEAPFAASHPDFHLSRHEGLRAYEQGHVKEGVAAGAMMAAAFLAGSSESRIISTIDSWYERITKPGQS